MPPSQASPASIDLEVQVTPPGAEVFLDKVRLGTAPAIFHVPPSSTPRRLELHKAGYATWSTNVTASRSMLVPARLERKQQPPARPKPEDLEKAQWNK